MNSKSEGQEMVDSTNRKATFTTSKTGKANISLQTLRSHTFQENLLSDIRFAVAIKMAQDLLEEKKQSLTDAQADKYRILYRRLSFLRNLSLVLYLCLSIFERPRWCSNNIYVEDECRAITGKGQIIPTSNMTYLPTWLIVLLEFVFITFLTFTKRLKRKYMITKKASIIQDYALISLTILTYISDVVEYMIGLTFPLNSLIRPVYFTIYARSVRKAVRLYGRILWRTRSVISLMVLNLFLFAALAKVLFYKTVENDSKFSTYWDAVYNLFVTQTTSNYPDIMMPAFTKHRYSIIFFAAFLISNYFLLFNLIIATFYYNFKAELQATLKQIVQKESLALVITEILESNLAKTKNIEEDLIAKGLPDIGHIIDLKMRQIREEKEELKRILSGSRLRSGILKALYSEAANLVLCIVSLMTFVLLVIQSTESLSKPSDHDIDDKTLKFNTTWLTVELILNVILFLDPLLRLALVGKQYILNSRFYMYELVTSTVIIIIMLWDLTVGLTPSAVYIMHYFLLTRFIRFIRYLSQLERFSVIFDVLYKLLPFFTELLAVLSLVFYTFSVLGVYLFGGKLRTDLEDSMFEGGLPKDYVYNNFNDFMMGIFTCFHLLVVNNWLYTVELTCRVMDNYGYRLFFVAFYWIAVIISLSIMIAFIIDMFVTQMSQKSIDENSEPNSMTENNESVLAGGDSANDNGDDLPNIEIRPPTNSVVILEKKHSNENELGSYNFIDSKEDNGIQRPLLVHQEIL